MTLDRMKKQALIEALVAFGGNRTKAAGYLGVCTRTVRYWIDRYKLKELFPPYKDPGIDIPKEGPK